MRPSYRIAIASHDRAETLATKTLPALQRGGIDLCLVDVWTTIDELGTYDAALPPEVWLRPEAKLGRAEARNAIARGYPQGQRLVQVDDDIERIVQLACECRYEDAEHLNEHFEWAFRQADELGFGLWGIDNGGGRFPKYKRFGATTRMRWVAGGLFGYTLAGDECDFVHNDDREDDERTLRCGLRDGGVLMLEYLALKTNTYTEPGGMQNQRTDKLVIRDANYLLENWPEHLTPVKRSDGRVRPQINLHRRYAADKTLIPGPDWAHPSTCERCADVAA